MAKNIFIIKRTDKDSGVDDVVIESEGLTIGRLVGNDLVLNHRAVSRTHAGIKEINGEFWIFNLSTSNGTVLNGQLADKTPLADGDVLQIGPYMLVIEYGKNALSIIVQREIEVNPLEAYGAAQSAGADETGKTMMIQIPGLAGKIPGGTKSIRGTGLLGNVLPSMDQAALDVFWEKRKREAGKIAEVTPLHPKGGERLGRARNNWRPTVDLRRLWRKSYFYLGAAVVVLLSIIAIIIYESAYSPGSLADPHVRAMDQSALFTRNIASRENANSCSTCHGVTTGMLDNCITCHTTTTTGASGATKAGFLPRTLIAGHNNQNLVCTDCHIEHQGRDVTAGLVSYRLCYNCHNGVYTIKNAGKIGPAGSVLPIPHGGKTGYTELSTETKGGKYWPGLSAARWEKSIARWRAKDPNIIADAKSLENSPSNQQFHKLHLGGIGIEGKQNNQICAICHFDQSGKNLDTQTNYGLHEAPRLSCAKCHTVSYTVAGAASQVPASCETCHQQHGADEGILNTAKIVADPGKEQEFLASLNKPAAGLESGFLPSAGAIGSADVIRQNRDVVSLSSAASSFGALPWYGWVAVIGIIPIAGLVFMFTDTARRKSYLKTTKIEVKPEDEAALALTGLLDLDKLKEQGPAYPHPVINQMTCIGCHACVDACPHDVLAIVNGKSTPIALDQCMEDTACQVECPTSPKSCIVVNTKKVIPPRKVPARDGRLETNVPGIYMTGDVSGTPLIKNAINEGRRVIDSVKEDLEKNGRAPGADYDVAIVGCGPAGLSATVLAKIEGLSYIAVEQDRLAGMIQEVYQAGKFVFYTPADKEVVGGVPLLPDPDKPEGNLKENMLKGWFDAMMQNGVVVNEEEGCRAVKSENGYFVLSTEKGKSKQKVEYKARKVILSIGNRGAPMKLGVPGEDLKITVTPPPQIANHCPKCGMARKGTQLFCVQCGQQLPSKTLPPFEDDRVQYKLSDPKDYVNRKCIVVGAGNSAIEVAVGLTGFERDGDKINFTSDNEVTLIVRSDFKGDLALGNKMNVYDCIDSGRMKAYFGCGIKEVLPGEVVIMNARTKEEKARIPNDYIFALIGAEKPIKFLESMGVKIGAEAKKG